MTLAARVARLLRANLRVRFGGAEQKPADSEPARTTSTPYSRAAQPAEPRPQPPLDPTLAGYYANLELPYGANREAVRAARRRLLSRYHPDRFPGDPDRARLANELVQQLNHAHDELMKQLDKEKVHA